MSTAEIQRKAIHGEVTVEVFEASRIKYATSLTKQSAYVKVKNGGKKTRTIATTGGTAPRWTEEHNNKLRLPVSNITSDLSVEIWRESKNYPNGKIDHVTIPVESYALRTGPPTPVWHKLHGQGALLFSTKFDPADDVKEDFDNLEKLTPQRAADASEIQHVQKYHDDDACDIVNFGDEITLHAMGKRFLKYGTCFRTHLQKSKKCLQLTKNLDESTVVLKVTGASSDNDSTELTYGTKFSLVEKESNTPVVVGTGFFEFVSADVTKKTIGTPVKYGDAAYLQLGGHTLGAEGESHHILDSTIYVSPHSARIAFTVAYADGLIKKTHSPAEKLSLAVTTYNVWMMPDKITTFADVSPKKNERAELIADSLPESDIVVFNEAFCHVARPILLDSMKEKGYVYESPVVGHLVGKAQAKFLDGGCVLVSKHPILETDIMRFGGVCKGDDALADKGVVYACVLKEGRRVHVFASHTQAWATEVAIKTRQDQFRMFRNFVDEKGIASNEPVILAGDFNVNKLKNDENHEYDEMMKILECNESPASEDQTTTASFDADNNPLAADGPSSDGICERLDYILTCQHHLQPFSSYIKINPIKGKVKWQWGEKGEFSDLSDHYPVTSKFDFNFS